MGLKIVLALFGVLILLAGCSAGKKTQSADEEATLPKAEFATKTSEGEVSIDLTPIKFENGLFIIEFSLNTHSVDLSGIDLQKQATLAINGKNYQPINKPELTSHHYSGELKFEVPEKPQNFEIVIVDVPDVKERRLKWE